MKYRKKNRDHDEISYWESMTDLMSALILIVLLIFSLVLLYIVRIPDADYTDLYEGDKVGEEYRNDNEGTYDAAPGETEHEDGRFDETEHYEEQEDSAGGGGDEHLYDYEYEYEYEYPGITEGNGKTAVHVTVIDGDTGKSILEQGVEFQLFRPGDILQVLNTYYPKKVEYSKFETTQNGTFYLPEKIPSGNYYFHELTAPEGYDPLDNLEFHVKEALDWPEAQEVEIPLYPARGQIRIRMTDKGNGAAVGGAAFDVIAAEDIITADGTLRFPKGQVVDHIVCEPDGNGISIELYHGSYELKETNVPEYYAQESEVLPAQIDRKTESLKRQNRVQAQKTEVVYQVLDELDHTSPVKGAVFRVTEENGAGKVRTYISDDNGMFTVTDLNKNHTYRVHQTAAADQYRIQSEDTRFSVSAEGYVEEQAQASGEIVNRMIRSRICIQDIVIGNQVSDYNAALYNSSGELMELWDSTGAAREINGLEPGSYQLILRGNRNKPYMLEVEDTCEVQEFRIRIWTISGILAVAGSAAGAGILIFLFANWLRRKHIIRKQSNE